MIEAVKITIEEWAGDNGIKITTEQAQDLADAIEIAQDMSMPFGYGVGQIEHQEKSEIQQLKNQIDLLERYISSKGYNIILFEDKIIRSYMVNWGERSYSQQEVFR